MGVLEGGADFEAEAGAVEGVFGEGEVAGEVVDGFGGEGAVFEGGLEEFEGEVEFGLFDFDAFLAGVARGV